MEADGLLSWAEQVTGGRVLNSTRLDIGNARITSILSMAFGESTRQFILRHEAGNGPLAGTTFSLAREAAVCRALAGRGLPVPEVIADDLGRSAMLTEKMSGEHDTGSRHIGTYLTWLRKLHDIDIATLDLPDFARTIPAEIEIWERAYRSHVQAPSPVADLAFERLRTSSLPEPARLVLCHGDAGFGNYLVQDDQVSALLDWEMAHFGDPLDDLVWIAIRAVQFNVPLPDFGSLIAENYGADVDLEPALVAFWKAFGLLRMLIICLLAVSRARSGKERLLQLTMLPGLEFQVLDSLAEMEGSSVLPLLDAAELSVTAFPGHLLGEAALDLGEIIIPGLEGGPHITNWAKRIRNLLRDLDRASRTGNPDASEVSLPALASSRAAQLRWLPSCAELARRPFPNFHRSEVRDGE